MRFLCVLGVTQHGTDPPCCYRQIERSGVDMETATVLMRTANPGDVGTPSVDDRGRRTLLLRCGFAVVHFFSLGDPRR